MRNLKIKIETKLENYVKITLVKNKILLPNGKIIPLEKGIVFSEDECFGFKIKSEQEKRMKSYPTNERLMAIDYGKTTKEIHIYEGHKFLPWVFDLEGNLIDVAQFLSSSRRDYRYLQSLGIEREEKIQEWNETYAKKYQKQKSLNS